MSTRFLWGNSRLDRIFTLLLSIRFYLNFLKIMISEYLCTFLAVFAKSRGGWIVNCNLQLCTHWSVCSILRFLSRISANDLLLVLFGIGFYCGILSWLWLIWMGLLSLRNINITCCKTSLKIETSSSIEWHLNCQLASNKKHWHGTRCPDVADITSVAYFSARKFTNDIISRLVAGSSYENVIATKHSSWTRWNLQRSWK